MEDAIDWMVLSQIPGIGVGSFWSLVGHFGSPSQVLRCSISQLQNGAEGRKKRFQGFAEKDLIRRQCLQQAAELKKRGGECLTFADGRYPEALRQISDPPPLLYVLGNHDLLQCCSVAVIGSRASTSYGSRVAFNLAGKLANRGVCVVAGLALGIDTEAHRGALAAGGKTAAVLGCGLDVIYPKNNSGLFREIVEKGVIVTEYPLGTRPEGFRFPARNRIIAGLSRGVVVVEAARKSGSLITAQLALDEGREVYAVPGQVDSCKSEGTHWLLQQGAALVQSENDILADLGLSGTKPLEDHEESTGELPSSLDEKARMLLDCIDSYPLPRDALVQKSGLEIFEISEYLLILELEGLIEVLPGDEIRRIS